MKLILTILLLLSISQLMGAPNLVLPKPQPSKEPTCVAMRLPEPGVPVARLWGSQQKLWPQRATLRVLFMDGNDSQKCRAWCRFVMVDKLVNLTFVKVASGPAEIRVSFRGEGHWSFVGRDNLSRPQSEPTMNLSLTSFDGSKEWTRVVPHEVFHACGFWHEHQHPQHLVPWNYPVVFADYLREQGWSEQETRFQVTDRRNVSDFIGSVPDQKSLMMYPVPARHVLDPTYVVGWNMVLSELDKFTARRLYP